jgi:transcriptional regulator with XRE-family HTH domain
MKTGHRIKLLRLLFGLSQDDLASLAGISRPSLLNYEQGGYNPIDDIVRRLSGIFAVEPGFFRYGSPAIHNHVWIPNIPKHTHRKQNIIDDLEKLFPEFLQENLFSSLVIGTLSDGKKTLLFGNDKLFDCLLIVDDELSEKLLAALHGLNRYFVEKISFGTIDNFDDNCLMFLLSEINELGFSFDFNSLRKALKRLEIYKGRTSTNLDAGLIVFEAQNNVLIREQLLQFGDAACKIITTKSLEEIAAGETPPTIPETGHSNQVLSAMYIIFKAAFDVIAIERNIRPSFPYNPLLVKEK